MKWIRPDKNIAHFRAKGALNQYDVKQYFLLDMQWVSEITDSNSKFLRLPGIFSKASKAKKVCELIEKG